MTLTNTAPEAVTLTNTAPEAVTLTLEAEVPSLLDQVLENTTVAATPPLPPVPEFVSSQKQNVKQNLALVKVMQQLAQAGDRDTLLKWFPALKLPEGVVRWLWVNQDWFKNEAGVMPMLVSDDGGKTWTQYGEVEVLGAVKFVTKEQQETSGCGGPKMKKSIYLETTAALLVK